MDEQRIKITQSVKRELFSSRFHCLAEEMGKQLERTAFSVNIRKTGFFLCSFGWTRISCLKCSSYSGSSWCVGFVCPSTDPRIFGFVRGRYSDFESSGIWRVSFARCFSLSPGFLKELRVNRLCSQSSSSCGKLAALYQVRCRAVLESWLKRSCYSAKLLVSKGKSQMSQIENILNSGPFPTRQLKENLSDLLAQIASLRMGCESLNKLISTHGSKEIMDQMSNLREESSSSCREFFEKIRNRRSIRNSVPG